MLNFNNIQNSNSILNIVSEYKSSDWKDYIPDSEFFEQNKNSYGYLKKLLFVNESFEVYLIFWSPLASSPIHDHPEKGCILKLLDGELNEELYQNKNNTIKYLETHKIKPYDINNRNGNEILHKIINSNNFSTSLHIYYPPKFKQNIYKV